MYALCVFGAVNTQGFVWSFFKFSIHQFSFIHSYLFWGLCSKPTNLSLCIQATNSHLMERLERLTSWCCVEEVAFLSYVSRQPTVTWWSLWNGRRVDVVLRIFFCVCYVSRQPTVTRWSLWNGSRVDVLRIFDFLGVFFVVLSNVSRQPTVTWWSLWNGWRVDVVLRI